MRVTALFFILIIAGISSLSRGQQTEAPQGKISVSEILQKNLIASGGLEAHKALETLVASGDIYLKTTQRIGDYKFSYKAPDNDMLEIRMAGHGANWEGHRAGRPVHGAMTAGLGAFDPGELCIWCVINGVNTSVVEHDWQTLLRWDFCCAYNIELIGIGEVDKRPAYGLRFTPKNGGSPFLCFYDRETFLLVRIDGIEWVRTSRNSPEKVDRVESIFRDYREQGGVKLPFVIAIPRPEGEVVFEVSKMKTGEPVKDSVFQ